MISSVTEDQIKYAKEFAKTTPHLNEKNNILGKLGEVAFHNLGQSLGFVNAYGNDLHNSIFKKLEPSVRDDGGVDYVMQSAFNKYIRLFAQIKTTVDLPNHNNIILNKYMYDSKLNYNTRYHFSPIDIFVFVKQLSESTYDIIGFITQDNAILKAKYDFPIIDCIGINEQYLQPIDNIKNMLK